MNLDQLRKLCLSFPGTTEQIQWGDDLLFKVGGKMFAVARLEPAKVWLSLKANPEHFADLTERPGVIPAPYLARAKWIALESPEAVPDAELAQLLRESYELVLAKLPRKLRESAVKEPALKGRAKKKRPGKTKEENEIPRIEGIRPLLWSRGGAEAGGHLEAETSSSRNYFRG